MGATHQARQARIHILAETLKRKKALPVDEVYKFAVNRWLISLRVINDYIRELTATGKYKIQTRPDGDWLVYLGE